MRHKYEVCYVNQKLRLNNSVIIRKPSPSQKAFNAYVFSSSLYKYSVYNLNAHSTDISQYNCQIILKDVIKHDQI